MSRDAYCIFCDDIRAEVGGKVSYMGIYSTLLGVENIPTVLPKLCIAVMCSTPIEEPFQSVAVRISKNGVVTQESTLPQEFLGNMIPEIAKQGWVDDPIKIITAGMHITISPFIVDTEGTLTVTVIADGTEYTAGKLRIRKAEALPA